MTRSDARVWPLRQRCGLLEAGSRRRIADRAGHVMKIRGNMVSGFVVDQLLRTAPGVLDAICFRNPKPDAPDRAACAELVLGVAHARGLTDRLKVTD